MVRSCFLITVWALSITWTPYGSHCAVGSSVNSSSEDINRTPSPSASLNLTAGTTAPTLGPLATLDSSSPNLEPSRSTTYLMNEVPELSDEEVSEVSFPRRPAASSATQPPPRGGARVRRPGPWPWLLIFLTGNSTIAAQRQRDLPTYLRLNLAARLDADYNDVAVNRLVINHQGFLANISVEPEHLVGIGAVGLEALSKGNVTLVQLSGQEYYVEKIVRPTDILGQKLVELEASAVDAEVAIYGAAGALVLFLVVVALIGLFLYGPCLRDDKDNGPLCPDNQGDSLCPENPLTAPPPVIYTEELAKQMDRSFSGSCAVNYSGGTDAKGIGCQSGVQIPQPIYAIPQKNRKKSTTSTQITLITTDDSKKQETKEKDEFQRQISSSSEKNPNFYGY